MTATRLLVVASAVAGCHAHPENCQLTCTGANHECVDGLICSEEGYCVEPGWSGTCQLGVAGAGGQSATGTSSNRGGSGTSSDGPFAGGSVAGASSPGELGGLGSGGTSGGAFSAAGGIAGAAPSGMGGIGTSLAGGAAMVGGTATAEGGATTGAAGASSGGSCDLSVNVPSLLPACLGEVYAVQLTATGGSPENLAWTASPETLPEGLTLSATGLLSGVIAKTGEHPFTVTVTDKTTLCTSAPAALSLTVHDETATTCPTIHVLDAQSGVIQPTPALAPPSCRGRSYLAQFAAVGGAETYTWQVISLPAGFDFDSVTRTLSAALPTANAAVTLQVTDAAGRSVRRDFAIPNREKCWLGYVSDESGAARLYLFDPLLGARLQRPASSAPELSVPDFKFSPDGKFVAYRVKRADGSFGLWLWQAPEWDRELELSLEGSVSHYAWSNDSKVLAAVMNSGTTTWLGGVKVDAVPSSSSPGTIQGVSERFERLGVKIDEASQLLWYGDDAHKDLAFDTIQEPGYPERMANDVVLGASGFRDLRPFLSTPYESIALYPSLDGYFIAERDYAYLDYRRNGFDGATYAGNAAVAPSGNFTALSDGSNLLLRRPYDTSTLAESAPCVSLLGWSKAQERLACVDSNGSVWLHTYDTQLGVFGTPTELENSTGYPFGSVSGHRRSMSPSGSWLALTTADRLYVASLSQSPPVVAWSSALATDLVGMNLGFAPDETLLAMQRGSSLQVFQVPALANGGLVVSTLAAEARVCDEDNLPAPTWCGSSRDPMPSQWSPDSRLLAFVNAAGALAVQDLRIWGAAGLSSTILVTTKCGEGCAGGVRFQP